MHKSISVYSIKELMNLIPVSEGIKRFKSYSKSVNRSDIFFVRPGAESYIEEAKKRGATSIIKIGRKEMAIFFSEYYSHPSRKLIVVGVTGTKGKTTVSWLVHQSLMSLGYNSYVMGSIHTRLTTPHPLDIQREMYRHLQKGGTHFIMEVSSEGYDKFRVHNVDFNLKVLTNLQVDHIDYHKSIYEYHATKKRFMSEGDCYTIYPKDYKKFSLNFQSPFKGAHNHDNLQTAVATLNALGISETDIKKGILESKLPPGRMEYISEGQAFDVVVDFAHTETSLKCLLESFKEEKNCPSKIFLIFGCGGNRDPSKRHGMGKVASKFADFVIITNDNPRYEDPVSIAKEIQSGFIQEFRAFKIILDRKKAIREIFKKAKKNDIILIAGRGCEKVQLINGESIEFDDREIAKELLIEHLSQK